CSAIVTTPNATNSESQKSDGTSCIRTRRLLWNLLRNNCGLLLRRLFSFALFLILSLRLNLRRFSLFSLLASNSYEYPRGSQNDYYRRQRHRESQPRPLASDYPEQPLP